MQWKCVTVRMKKLKNKFSMETLKDIIILMMSQKTVRFGWEFLDSISKCASVLLSSFVAWTNDKLDTLIKLIVNDEQFVDIAEGDDGGLFEFFPFLSGTIHIRAAPNDEDDEEEDSAGSLVDFIEDDVVEQSVSDSSSSNDSFSEEEDSDEVIDLSDDNSAESTGKRSATSLKPPKKRKVIVESSSSDCPCLRKKQLTNETTQAH